MSVTRPATQTPRRIPVRRMLMVTPFIVIAMGAAVMGARARMPDDQIVTGVHVGDLDLGGKSIEEARPALEQWAGRIQSTTVLLHLPADAGVSRTWRPDAAKLGLSVNVESTLDAAVKAGRVNIAGQVGRIFAGSKSIPISPVPTADDGRLKAYLKRQVAGDINRKPKNARFVLLRGGGFGTHHEQNGLAVKIDASADAVRQAWTGYVSGGAPLGGVTADKTTAPGAAPEPTADQTAESPDTRQAPVQNGLDAEISVNTVPAALTTADLEQINSVLGAKSSFVNGTPARLGNIRIASGRINGTLLKPGDVFSYNEIVGPRDEDSGYREAPILIRGHHDKGIAGGICQTSGTLFNAVLKSGLKIVEREHHSTPIGYLPVGLDATVSYGSLDLKFQNDTPAPVYIAASLRGRELTFTLFGKETPGREVTLVRGALSRTGASYETQADRTRPAGYRRVVERGASGARVTWYRIIKVNGAVVHRDVISSHYSPHPGLVLVGTAAPKSRPARRAPPRPGSTPAVFPGEGGPAPPGSANGAPQR